MMRLVTDTNILYSYFWKSSLTGNLIINKNMEFFSPEFALEEINKHKKDIMRKTKITENEFNLKKFDLAIFVKFIPIEAYGSFLKKALKISPDQNDIDFIALSLKLRIPLWSNDYLLKKQNEVKILTTSDVVKKIK